MAIACTAEPTYSLCTANKWDSYEYGFDNHGTYPANGICEITSGPYDTSLDGYQKDCHGTSPKALPLKQHPLE